MSNLFGDVFILSKRKTKSFSNWTEPKSLKNICFVIHPFNSVERTYSVS